METPPDWTATALFSPSKARFQQAQARDWASVDSWLSKRYASKRLPNFERNEDTLQALLTLATLNEGADEQRSLIDRVEKAALQAHSKRLNGDAAAEADLQPLLSGLEGDDALAVLAETVVCLNSPSVDLPTMANAVVDLTAQKFAAEQQVRRAEDQIRTLRSEQSKVSKLLNDLKDDAFQPPANLLELTADWTRNSKHLKAKVAEYDERLTTLRAIPRPKIRIEHVVSQTDDLVKSQARLAELQGELDAFQSLPSDPKAARAKLETAREELRRLTRQRDELFEHLVDDG
ncbi:hypothetical protein LTR37_004911 [Vermiconidia calcicola]|uniref:Uncharacterized protein n=1 Tax=Vermiconidia calcicola TaxID=1690605 RepID=A0ACC3NL39_9PEZI|nr:hypothetical protein LTR37_004911 [Vermiconidia calcicola]